MQSYCVAPWQSAGGLFCGDIRRIQQRNHGNVIAVALKLPGNLESHQSAGAQTPQQIGPMRLNTSNVTDVKFRHLFETSVEDWVVRLAVALKTIGGMLRIQVKRQAPAE